MSRKQTVLTGMRPSGDLHLGHYAWALSQWLRYESEYACNFLIADYHVLSEYEPDHIRASVLSIVTDWLAVGLDPEKSNFILQSGIPEFAELAMLLSMQIHTGALDRNPTLKAEMAKQKQVAVGFYNYPVSQAADILLLKGDLVPVWDDQIPHIELTREIARRFNKRYGETFPEPKHVLSHTPRLVGVDGNEKMSKSLKNTIGFGDTKDEIAKKVRQMRTDPRKQTAYDPGHFDGNVVFTYLDAFYPTDRISELQGLKDRYVSTGVPDGEVKALLVEVLEGIIAPIRHRRNVLLQDPGYVMSKLREWTGRAKETAWRTMVEVREKMGIGI